MQFTATAVEGVFVVDLVPRSDERGFFARAYCAGEFERQGIAFEAVQANNAVSLRKGTLRGLHWQAAPHPEAKFFRCIGGANHHVVVDMRPGSATYLRHCAVELSSGNRRGLYVPPYCAHGYQALTDGAEAFYLVGGSYHAEAERGLRYDDPALGIAWPLPVAAISPKDRSWPMIGAGTN